MNNEELKQSANNVLKNKLFISQLQTLFCVADLEDDQEKKNLRRQVTCANRIRRS